MAHASQDLFNLPSNRRRSPPKNRSPIRSIARQIDDGAGYIALNS
jgi:hypothetical protein